MQVAYALADAPEGTSRETLIRASSTRDTVEQCIEQAKDWTNTKNASGTVGMDVLRKRGAAHYSRRTSSIRTVTKEHPEYLACRLVDVGSCLAGRRSFARTGKKLRSGRTPWTNGAESVPLVSSHAAFAARSPDLRLLWSMFPHRERFWIRRSHVQRRLLDDALILDLTRLPIYDCSIKRRLIPIRIQTDNAPLVAKAGERQGQGVQRGADWYESFPEDYCLLGWQRNSSSKERGVSAMQETRYGSKRR